jgi:hypothetical protein
MDEPLGALDKKLRDRLQIEIKSIQQELGLTVIYVTHDQEEALVMSDRIAVMRNGLIEQFDTPGELFELQKTPFIADFLGAANFLPGRISHSELAGKVLLSRNAVRQRIERLERGGHIAGYTTVRAGGDTGDVVTALVLVYRQYRMRGGDVLAALKRIPEVVICEISAVTSTSWCAWRRPRCDVNGAPGRTSPKIPGARDTVTALTLFRVVNRPRGEQGLSAAG